MTITVRTRDGQTITGVRPIIGAGALTLCTREVPEAHEWAVIGLDNVAEVIAR